MPRTVKIRPDQPLFKADAFRMPLWVHAPFEVVRGFYKWMTAGLGKDNPHRDPLKNATLTRGASAPHRNAFWTGQPVRVGPKWRIITRRWLWVFTVLALIKYLPWAGWVWLFKRVGSLVRFVGWDATRWGWRHLWALPVAFIGLVAFGYGVVWGVRRVGVVVKRRYALVNGRTDGAVVPWYEVVLGMRDRAHAWACRRGWIR